MRKFLALLAILFCLLPSARADRPDDLPLPYGADTVISVVELTDTQRILAHYLYTPVFNGEEKILLPQGTRYDAVAPAMRSLMQDYPELFHLGRDYTIGYYQHQPDIALWIEPQYRLSQEEAAALRAELYLQAYLMADQHPDAEALHDALCSRVTYQSSTPLCHTAAGALLNGQAACEGYAQALCLIYRMADIPCGVVTGTAVNSAGQSERHAWNIAAFGGFSSDACCLIDATWNDQDALNLNTHWYYGLSTGQMAADHIPDADQLLPECDEQANWHLRHGYTIHTAAQADAFIRRLVDGETINLRMDRTMYTALTDDFTAWLDHYNKRNPDAPFCGAYSMIASDAQLCVILQAAE